MPTIQALPTVPNSELNNLDDAVMPIVYTNQTRKIGFKNMREVILPKVLSQALSTNQESVVFNNPSSITVNQYGQVTSVTPAGNQSPSKIDAVQIDKDDFLGDGTVISSGVATIKHRSPPGFEDVTPTSAYFIPPFTLNRSGHVHGAISIQSPTLYQQRSTKLAQEEPVSVGTSITPPERDVSIEAYLNQVLTTTLDTNYNPTQLTNYLQAMAYFMRTSENAFIDVLDRLNRLLYAVKRMSLAGEGGYLGASDNTFIEHRSRFIGVYNFAPDKPIQSDLIEFGNATASTRQYLLAMIDNETFSSTTGKFSTLINYQALSTEFPSIASGETRNIWDDIRIGAYYTPAAVYNSTAGGGGYAGNITQIYKEHIITKAKFDEKLAQFNANQTQNAADNWEIQSVNGKRAVVLKGPTVAELRTVNVNFAKGPASTSNNEEYQKNQLLVYLIYSGRANTYWIPAAGSTVLPNASAANASSPIVSIGFGNSGRISLRAQPVP